ncbi:MULTISPECIES: TetR/AcrR family transcriptional regulator [Streptomyces]|uniref:TetR family transcriptional regulator n=1 Tax=Streptomyces venezuelae TaxID=54571 RepID=A0A5P2B6G1_STRVZ|nr:MULTISPECIES: TetR/AcrR family transcriptional regulator [Streptomyces]NEA01824.1 TetR/AcrR family transcriptional regulator [Streptomyces sp. SID10116]MYY83675.1 TetR family transcriptional regulator [Streptomyces sp. SID335]MYZ16727.1 TetR family transcriptional regulator [Streptomyces sp. SID337]NDZ87139.1 TetR/AcrR family transcriptional regulator [Streptomyces sp. SID10115]NEB45966.1 TetR/AcrR family transcriptional regulator [Streptomyces sp. SID339]
MGTDRLDEVLDAAYDCLTRYGARRTTMDDIASAMGVSRSAVYQYVRGKDDAFRRLAGRLHEQALRRAREAASADVPYAERLHGVLAAKLDLVLQLAGDSPHATELLDGKARLFGDICTSFTTELREVLTGLFTEAGTVAGVAPAEAADICVALVVGLEGMRDPRGLLAPATDALATGLLDTAARAENP